MELLRRTDDRGYPAEYLLARIRGRRAHLISDWTPVVFSERPFEYLLSAAYAGFLTGRSAEGIRRDLMKEYLWVYLRLDSRTLGILSPFFLYSELRTIFICLRQIHGKKPVVASGAISDSLLSEDLKRVLTHAKEISTVVKDIEGAFLNLSGAFEGVVEYYHTEGLRGFERELSNRYLVTIVRDGLHPLMKEFFVRIIDSRNVIALYKFLRLEPKSPPAFIPCGNIGEREFSAALENRDMGGLLRLAGVKGQTAGDETAIERRLYTKITEFLRKAGRDPLGIGTLLDYLWRTSIEAMNFGIISYGGKVDRELIRMDLVQ